MILSHLSNSQLIAQIKRYDIIINYSTDNTIKNIITFRDECKKELNKRWVGQD